MKVEDVYARVNAAGDWAATAMSPASPELAQSKLEHAMQQVCEPPPLLEPSAHWSENTTTGRETTPTAVVELHPKLGMSVRDTHHCTAMCSLLVALA
jgi:hypothetical protein